jgi:hypothetical protein
MQASSLCSFTPCGSLPSVRFLPSFCDRAGGGMDQNRTIVAELLRFSEVYPTLHGSVPLDASLK